MRTVWILGDQINREIASLADVSPDDTRILMVHSRMKIEGKRWHRQRLHLVITAMMRFAEELRAEGFEVDERQAPTLAAGVEAHRAEFDPDEVVAMEPLSWDGWNLLERLNVQMVASNQMLCHVSEFASWVGAKKRTRMEEFYRWQRRRLDILMDGDEPAGGRWNFDDQNRLPPPKGKVDWPETIYDELDALDRKVIEGLPDNAFGAEPDGLWATDRDGALARLDHFIEHALPRFGPHEDAMLADEVKLAHAMLSHALNIGLLMPGEVAEAAESAYRNGDAPIESVEGFIRQIIGWREYIWNVYWHWMPEYRDENGLDAKRPLPPLFTNGSTHMRCVDIAVQGVDERAWLHHIQRLMVLGNFAMLSGIEPKQMVEWMWASFIDGAEWVMLPNLTGMALYADGGRMSTKPYAGGGSYINRMSNYCKGCRYDPKKRTGEDACPFTSLYWDFLARHEKEFAGNMRMRQTLRGMHRLSDLPATRARASEVLELLDKGEL